MIEAFDATVVWLGRIAVCAAIGALLWLVLYVALAWLIYGLEHRAPDLRAYARGLVRHPGLVLAITWSAVMGAMVYGSELTLWTAVIAWASFSAPAWALVLLTVQPEEMS